jgi:hypothetical protein
VDRQRVFEGATKVTRAAPKFITNRWRGQEGRLEGQHLDAKAMEAMRERPTTRNLPDRRRNRAAISVVAARPPVALKTP